MKSIRNNGSMSRPTSWGRRPHLIQSYFKRSVKPQKNTAVKSGSQKFQASMVRRWLHELKLMNHLENLGSPRSLCLFPTKPKPENIRCKRNTDHPTHPAYACSSFLFYKLCGRENATSTWLHSSLSSGRKQLDRDIFKEIRDWNKVVGFQHL